MPIEDELLERLKDEEDALVERKPTADKDEIRAAACAFANTVKDPNTGVLFLGVARDGTPNGKMTNPDDTQRQIRNKYLPRCYPPIEGFQTYALTVGGKHAVAVVVHESRNRPHFTGPAYVRVGSETVEASAAKYQELIEERNDLVWALKPWVGRLISVQQEQEYPVAPGYHGWTSVDRMTLESVNNFYATLGPPPLDRDGRRGFTTFSLKRVMLEYDMQNDCPLLRMLMQSV
jgi:hypothetical protein